MQVCARVGLQRASSKLFFCKMDRDDEASVIADIEIWDVKCWRFCASVLFVVDDFITRRLINLLFCNVECAILVIYEFFHSSVCKGLALVGLVIFFSVHNG